MSICLNRVFLLANIGVFMPLVELNGGCIRCGHGKLSFIYFFYHSLSPVFWLVHLTIQTLLFWNCLRREGRRAEGAYFGFIPHEKCKGTLTTLWWRRFIRHWGLHLCVWVWALCGFAGVYLNIVVYIAGWVCAACDRAQNDKSHSASDKCLFTRLPYVHSTIFDPTFWWVWTGKQKSLCIFKHFVQHTSSAVNDVEVKHVNTKI